MRLKHLGAIYVMSLREAAYVERKGPQSDAASQF
jgi:hypothetical protein